jgi:hypothetical protein
MLESNERVLKGTLNTADKRFSKKRQKAPVTTTHIRVQLGRVLQYDPSTNNATIITTNNATTITATPHQPLENRILVQHIPQSSQHSMPIQQFNYPRSQPTSHTYTNKLINTHHNSQPANSSQLKWIQKTTSKRSLILKWKQQASNHGRS